ncbi:condensation domain-containing protein [Luedemannella flava]
MSHEWRLAVTFAGEGAGEAPLAWGQQEIWSAMCRQETWLPIGGTLPAPPGSTLEDFAGELRFLVERHQTMRTLLELPDGGRARQVVHNRGEIGMTVVDVAPGDDPAAEAERIRQRFWTTPYDARREWPVRMAVVRLGGVPTHTVAVFCHLVMDAFGGAAMMTDLAGRDPDTGAAAARRRPCSPWSRRAGRPPRRSSAARAGAAALGQAAAHRAAAPLPGPRRHARG